ncbi:CAP domain-containing protein [uncultured Rhodospira sp.]|uniref:CAP domain-containing protein n=1 Tax=uncultured Rhodospira sp. TaxID=1936189 RepID=UPI0026102500|nr:CAP domain-containing protein [uncultured Rhodospira sp.]
MAELTANEQYMLELVNRARQNPAAEAALFGIDLNQDLQPGTITADAKAPLAPNTLLTDAALGHSAWMIAADTFSHTGQGGSTLADRIADAGYILNGPNATAGENIAWIGNPGGTIDLEAAIVEQHEGLFLSSGHRTNILYDGFREVGIGQQEGIFTSNGIDYTSSLLTQNFGRTGESLFLTGVIYDDQNQNAFYNPGEGLGSVSISIDGAVTATSQGAGGYSVALSPGTYTVTFSGGGLDADRTETVTLSDRNVKVDVLDSSDAVPADPVVPDGTVALYRFFNTKAGGHFFTALQEERDTVIQTLDGFTYESVDFAVRDADDSEVDPVYRFFNHDAGGHFFTQSEEERDNVLANLPQYRYEGVGFYADPDGGGDTSPVYRFFNTDAGGHFFTQSEEERDNVLANLPQYIYEGVGFHAWDIV